MLIFSGQSVQPVLLSLTWLSFNGFDEVIPVAAFYLRMFVSELYLDTNWSFSCGGQCRWFSAFPYCVDLFFTTTTPTRTATPLQPDVAFRLSSLRLPVPIAFPQKRTDGLFNPGELQTVQIEEFVVVAQVCVMSIGFSASERKSE
jgi:hypothetical protein